MQIKRGLQEVQRCGRQHTDITALQAQLPPTTLTFATSGTKDKPQCFGFVVVVVVVVAHIFSFHYFSVTTKQTNNLIQCNKAQMAKASKVVAAYLELLNYEKQKQQALYICK